MTDFFDTLAYDAKATISSGYYKTTASTKHVHVSLRSAIKNCKRSAVITEIKTASPSMGTIRANINPQEITAAMAKGGAVGISVLTEPKHFNGSLSTLMQAREAVNLPILMKDIILSPIQIEAGAKTGANAVLLIKALFDRGYGELGLKEMIEYAHGRGLEVLLETHTAEEFEAAVQTNADIIGINNRNLANLKIDLGTTKQILQTHKNPDKIIISESGIQTPQDLQFLKTCGAQGFLIGSSIMLTDNIEEKVKEFVEA